MSNLAGYFSRSAQGLSAASMWMQRAGQAVRAHEARDALHAALLVLVQPVHAAVGLAEHAALLDGHVLAAFLGVLDDAVLAAEHAEHVLHRRAQALEHLRQVELVGQRQLGFFEDEDVGVFHGSLSAGW